MLSPAPRGTSVGDSGMTKKLVGLSLLVLSSVPLGAQSIDDSLMVPKKAFFTGFSYGHDRWSEYWEGTLKRENGNVGTLTSNSVTWMGNYGLFNRLNLIVMLPYVSTKASGGTLSPQDGLQDLTVAAKYRVFEARRRLRERLSRLGYADE